MYSAVKIMVRMVKLDKGLDLGLDAKRIGKRIKETAKKARNEEELKIKVEGLIQKLIAKFFELGKEPEVAYEHKTTISGKREDALYGTAIIEYKAPKKLDTESEFEKAKEQIEAYIKEEADSKPENFGKFFGVILDGYKISFVRFRRNQWVADEPTELSEESVYRLLGAIISSIVASPYPADKIDFRFLNSSSLSNSNRKTLSLNQDISTLN